MALVHMSCCSRHSNLRNCSRIMELLRGDIFPPGPSLTPISWWLSREVVHHLSHKWEENIIFNSVTIMVILWRSHTGFLNCFYAAQSKLHWHPLVSLWFSNLSSSCLLPLTWASAIHCTLISKSKTTSFSYLWFKFLEFFPSNNYQ